MKNYLDSVKLQFKYYQTLGERSFSQLSDDELFSREKEEDNSIGIIVKHLWGNMMSRWTDFLSSDGEKEWRKREAEFDADIKSREELLDKWNAGWSCLYTALDSVSEENFEQLIYIRNQGHTIVEAINRQLAHYAYHVGQIVFVAKTMKGSDWQSLSIPKGGSKAFNAEKFSKEKSRQHFTKEFLDKGDVSS